jgi:hypothetical protein
MSLCCDAAFLACARLLFVRVVLFVRARFCVLHLIRALIKFLRASSVCVPLCSYHASMCAFVSLRVRVLFVRARFCVLHLMRALITFLRASTVCVPLCS